MVYYSNFKGREDYYSDESKVEILTCEKAIKV
jgi:hypothetical protein